MKINKIVIALNEQIFLEFCKTLDIKNIKTNEDTIIWEKDRNNSEWEEEILTIIHWKDIAKTLYFIKSTYILIDKIILTNSANILSNWELQEWDVIVPNTFIADSWDAKFLESTIWEDYDLKSFWLVLNGICSDSNSEADEFQADIVSEWIYNYLTLLEKEELFSKVSVVLQIWKKSYTNLIAVSDMSL